LHHAHKAALGARTAAGLSMMWARSGEPITHTAATGPCSLMPWPLTALMQQRYRQTWSSSPSLGGNIGTGTPSRLSSQGRSTHQISTSQMFSSGRLIRSTTSWPSCSMQVAQQHHCHCQLWQQRPAADCLSTSACWLGSCRWRQSVHWAAFSEHGFTKTCFACLTLKVTSSPSLGCCMSELAATALR
jgi:hypothetical protein